MFFYFMNWKMTHSDYFMFSSIFISYNSLKWFSSHPHSTYIFFLFIFLLPSLFSPHSSLCLSFFLSLRIPLWIINMYYVITNYHHFLYLNCCKVGTVAPMCQFLCPFNTVAFTLEHFLVFWHKYFGILFVLSGLQMLMAKLETIREKNKNVYSSLKTWNILVLLY